MLINYNLSMIDISIINFDLTIMLYVGTEIVLKLDFDGVIIGFERMSGKKYIKEFYVFLSTTVRIFIKVTASLFLFLKVKIVIFKK